jgi:predicted DNA-binding mobile mystery protein A
MVTKRYNQLARRHFDSVLGPLAGAIPEPPSIGWIAATREALGMSGPQLAGRLGITRGALRKLEASEVAGTIKVETLERVSEALGSRLRYALVPNVALERQVGDRALAVARREMAALDQTMRLEGQLDDRVDRSDELARRVRDLHDSRRLWDEPYAG